MLEATIMNCQFSLTAAPFLVTCLIRPNQSPMTHLELFVASAEAWIIVRPTEAAQWHMSLTVLARNHQLTILPTKIEQRIFVAAIRANYIYSLGICHSAF